MRKLLVFLVTAVALSAQARFEFWPGTVYDPAVPTFEKVLGYGAGEKLASYAEIAQYFEALAAASGGRMKVVEYGKSWEGRKLFYAVIASEANQRRMTAIQADIKKLADPRKTPEAEAKRIMAGLPAVVWLGYTVHGNELSGSDSAMLTAYHLLAARNQKMVADVLANTVILIDPLQNPDGRTRFVNNFEQAYGIEADGSTVAAERNEPWPGGRSNHYLFDMNRDWFALTQPETVGRIKMLLEWFPLVAADLHEMGSESTYYFAPEAIPFNPHLTKEQKTSLDWFGKNNAKYFDQMGYSYFTREVYDAFFPGYGAAWPAYHGTIAMTYENAAVRGMLYNRLDGSAYTFKESVKRHFVTSVATCEAAAMYRTQLLENFWAYRKTAIEEGKTEPVKGYILSRKGDGSAADKLAELLVTQGVEVGKLASGAQGAPDGSYVVSLAQPAKRLIRTMLDKKVEMEPDFLAEQERRRKKKLGDEIYDVTAWSLPLLYGVEAIPVTSLPGGATPFTGARPKPAAPAKAQVAYFVPWGTQAAGQFLTAALRAGLKIHTLDKAFVQNGRTFDRGTLAVKVKENPANVHDLVLKSQGYAEIVASDSAWVESGINLGSRSSYVMKKPAIALAWDRPVAANSAGAVKWMLERQYGYPVTAVRMTSLAGADLSKFDVLILPDAAGDYGAALGAGAIRRIKEWVANGGTVIGIEAGVEFLADAKVGLLATAREQLAVEKKVEPVKPDASGQVPGKVLGSEAEFLQAISPEKDQLDVVQGILAVAKTDPDHWLTAGVAPTVTALLQGRTVFTPLKLNAGTNAAYFAGADQLVASGYLWEESRKQFAYKPLVMVQREGRGHVIGFTNDPNFRGYMDGLNVFFLNAVFRGVAHSR
jgi:hypothetical protein